MTRHDLNEHEFEAGTAEAVERQKRHTRTGTIIATGKRRNLRYQFSADGLNRAQAIARRFNCHRRRKASMSDAENDRAFELLETAYNERDDWFVGLLNWTFFSTVRSARSNCD